MAVQKECGRTRRPIAAYFLYPKQHVQLGAPHVFYLERRIADAPQIMTAAVPSKDFQPVACYGSHQFWSTRQDQRSARTRTKGLPGNCLSGSRASPCQQRSVCIAGKCTVVIECHACLTFAPHTFRPRPQRRFYFACCVRQLDPIVVT